MKYIKSFESHRSLNSVNEEFIGGLIKNLKNKLSLKFSKMFGKAGEADKIIEKYKQEAIKAHEVKAAAVKAFAEYEKNIINGGDKDDAQKKQLQAKLQQAEKLYTNNLELIKKKYDIQINQVVEEEKDKRIQNYINIKKLEIQQEILQQETNLLQSDLGLTEDMLQKSPELKAMQDGIKKMLDENQKKKDEEAKTLSNSGGEKSVGFDIEAAKKDKNYNWKDSDFSKGTHKFQPNEEITYWSNDNFTKQGDEYEGTKATVVNSQVEDMPEVIEVKTDKGGFKINKGKIMSSSNKKEEESKPAEKE